MKRYFFNLTMNTRDLGGYNTKYHCKTKYLRFLRSDALNYINEEDKLFLLENNIKVSIDLRTEIVTERYPSKLKDDNRFKYYNFPFIEGSQITLTRENVSDLYLRMVNNYDNFYNIFSIISECEENIIINCTAGKDRTGVLCCLLLLLAGVSQEDIVKDYEVSEIFIEEKINEVRAFNPSFPETMGESKKEAIEGFLKLFFENYGSIENYLTTIGLTKKQIEKVKNKLIGE
ncbi:MAG: tyrosine-protein phosphatase [Bacillales bacterium]|nr:tyrosine-protein phosphatase [Bacillales bacterium]